MFSWWCPTDGATRLGVCSKKNPSQILVNQVRRDSLYERQFFQCVHVLKECTWVPCLTRRVMCYSGAGVGRTVPCAPTFSMSLSCRVYRVAPAAPVLSAGEEGLWLTSAVAPTTPPACSVLTCVQPSRAATTAAPVDYLKRSVLEG